MSRGGARNLDYAALLRASRLLDSSANQQEVKLALLSDAATQRMVPLFRALLHERGINAEIYEAPFDAIELQVYDSRSGLYKFQPDFMVVLNAVQALRTRFMQRSGSASAFVQETLEGVVRTWEGIQARSTATIIQSNFVLPYERFFGNFDQKVPDSFYAVAMRLNALLAQEASKRTGVLIQDVEGVASWIGRSLWFDDRFWDMAKSYCALEYLPAVAQNVVDIVMASRGHVTKCVVVDLDNTLWGGVVADDGLDNLRLGAHGEGEAFHRFQCYLRELANRGILLAVCSKNDMKNALLPFQEHPEMVLKREHFVAFMANWSDKAENIRNIREALNIGFDSMVFLDDNPFERNLVRELLPEVTVPELPEDPADYVRAISELNLFEATSFSAEDVKRAELYRKEAERKEIQARFATVDEFLKSLDMRMTAERFDSFHLPRIAQLIQRSNQFNLTTRRRSEAECAALMNDPRWIPLYAKLADRLSDHGLISVVILERGEKHLVIRDWLMSCRVLSRGVEQCLMNEVFERARQEGLELVTGEYIPTAKNGLVKGFFEQFGFRKIDELDGGHTRWALETSAYQPATVLIRLAETAQAEIST